jgi:glycosyltransferase involved in cell wall biosynthesis
MAEPLVILHSESSTGWGGQENRTLDESIGLRSLGARVIVLCQPGSRLGERAAEQAVEARSVPMRNNLDWQAVRSILRVIREEDVNIVNTHSGRDSLLAGIAGRLSGRRPIIVRTRHLALPITSKITYGLLPHKVVTVSGYVRSALVERGIAPERIVAIPTGVDVRGRFDPDAEAGRLKQELGLPADVPLVGTVAILRFKKGHHVLIEAIPQILRAVPDAVFVFAGDGPQHENIAHAIRDRGLEGTVRLLGLRRDIPNVLKSIDVFVLPTLEEALGTSFLEAMAMGKPVVGTRVGGVVEVIREGVSGFLVKPNDPAHLAEATIRILREPEQAKTMGMEGRKIVEAEFTVERMCQRMHDLYRSMLAQHPRPRAPASANFGDRVRGESETPR